MTNSTAGVRLGGSGYSYGDYQLPDAKKPAIFDEDGKTTKQSEEIDPSKSKKPEIEIFLFTLKDPVKTIISKLMDLIAVHGNQPIPPIDIKMAETGPMGYTSMFAFQPTQGKKPTQGLIRPTMR